MDEQKSMLVIDDEKSICRAFERFFGERNWLVDSAGSGNQGLQLFQNKPYNLLFVDVRLPDMDGLDLIDQMKVFCQKTGKDLPPIVVISAYGSLETVTRAIQGRANDYLSKPIDLDEAATIVDRLTQKPIGVVESTSSTQPSSLIVGKSPIMQKVFKQIGLVATSRANILIVGPTGSGKELVARAIHALSDRSQAPFIAVNCGALPDNLVESELFGYEKGAFTGATLSRPGRFEAAHHGTLFLDEIAELPLPAQVKLLRVLDTQLIERLGSVESRKVDVRIIAATNRSLEEEVQKGTFRQDLYFRLNVIRIEVPPLKERPEDIELLVHHFLKEFRHHSGISQEALECLTSYSWPGNVRELRNAIQHAVVMAGETPILPQHLPEPITRVTSSSPLASSAMTTPNTIHQLASLYINHMINFSQAGSIYVDTITEVERVLFRLALERFSFCQTEAAQWLGIHRNTLRYKIRELQLDGFLPKNTPSSTDNI